MQSYEEAPPPYPGTMPNAGTHFVATKGNYKGVPVYEVRSNDAPVFDQTAYQQAPVMMAGPTIIQTRPSYVGHNPVHCICPQCHQQIVTRVEHDSGSFAWLMCLLLTVIGFEYSMSSGISESLVTSTMKKPSLKSDELKYRTENFKQSLAIWRNILLPLNNLLEWEHNYDPFVIFGIITFIFIFILQANPPVLTLVSCVVLVFVLIDLLVPMAIRMLFKNENWTSARDAKYTRLCERIANFEEHIKKLCESALKMRKERPLMYLMVGGIFLAFIAFCGQRIDNLLLSYLTTLTICLIPGIRNRQVIPFIRQQIIDFWNNKKAAASSSTPYVSVSSSTPTVSSVKTSSVIRPSSNQPTHTLYSTTSYGSNKTKAQ